MIVILLQDPKYRDDGVSHQVAQLNRYMPRPKSKDGHYLIESKRSAADAKEEAEQREVDEKEAAAAAIVGAGADRDVSLDVWCRW